jgi:hypothetical protein
MPEPLATFIIEGTKAHQIAAKQANALFFYWPKIGRNVMVPKGGGFKTHLRGNTLWVGKGHVDHPGTKANPFPTRAMARWMPEARRELARISLRWAQDVTSE